MGHEVEPDTVLAVFGVLGEDSPFRGPTFTVARFITLFSVQMCSIEMETGTACHVPYVAQRRYTAPTVKLEKLHYVVPVRHFMRLGNLS